MEVLEDVLEAVVQCDCAAGCPSCVLPGSARVESVLAKEVMEYPYPKEATRWLIHRLTGRKEYQPDLTGVPATMPVPPTRPEPLLDERTERKVRKVARWKRKGGRS
jgi:ATP-dependent helicase YprA (DUF1998 family)